MIPSIHPIYFFPGPEIGMKRDRITEIRRNIANKDNEEPEYYHIYPYDTPVADIISLLENGALFSSRRMIVFSDIHALSADGMRSLKEYIDSPSLHAVLILATDHAPGTRNYPFRLADIIPKHCTEVFWEMFETDKRGWTVNFFRDKGMKIDYEAIDLLLDLTEGTTDALREACERLCFLDQRQIGQFDVDKVLEHGRSETIYSIFDHLCQRDLSGVLEAYRKILHSEPASVERILMMLADPLIRLMDFKIRIARGQTEKHAASEVKLKGGKRVFREYCDGARRYSTGELQEAVRSLIELEAWLRESPHELRTRKIELWFCRIIHRGYE